MSWSHEGLNFLGIKGRFGIDKTSNGAYFIASKAIKKD
jgi:hypothetical protein